MGGWRLILASSCAASSLSPAGAASWAGAATGVITGVGIAGASLETGVDSDPVVSLWVGSVTSGSMWGKN